jgi:hypothetical protein
MNTTKLTLEDFMKKSVELYQKRKTCLDVETNIGTVTFARPTESELLVYITKTSDAVVTDKADKVISQDMLAILDASKELVYSTCGYLKNVDLQKSLEVVDPLDIVTKIFGINKTMEIAGEIAKEFMDAETQKKVEKTVKN